MLKKSVLTIPVCIPRLKLSLVIPVAHLETIQTITRLLDRLIPLNYELLVTEDIAWTHTQLRIIHLPDNLNLGARVIRAWQSAEGNILGVIPTDTQFATEILLQLLHEMDKGADLATVSLICSRFSPVAKTMGLLILPEVSSRLRNPLSDYFLVRRETITNQKLNPIGSQILLEVLAKGQIYKIIEIDYCCKHRNMRLTYRNYWDYFSHLIKLRLSRSSRFIRFCVVGIGGVFVDMMVLYFLSDPSWFNLSIVFSKIIASEAGIIHNFLWNDAWTFRDIASKNPGITAKLKRLIKFNFVCFTGLVISVFVLYLLYNYLLFDAFKGGKYVANLLAIAVVTFWNFWLHSQLSWRVKNNH